MGFRGELKFAPFMIIVRLVNLDTSVTLIERIKFVKKRKVASKVTQIWWGKNNFFL